ncbi:hemin-degrading family protein [Lelliottia amnigena]|nr:hemin-degrading family protein [Lelliottia amnigena]
MNHYTRWLELKEENPGKYARDIAGLMNLSEAELTFARVGHDAWRLHGDIRAILGALETVGEQNAFAATNTPFMNRSARSPINTLMAMPGWC